MAVELLTNLAPVLQAVKGHRSKEGVPENEDEAAGSVMEGQDEGVQPKKKAKIDSNGEAAETPYDRFDKAFKAKRKALNAGCMVIRPIKNPDASTDEAEDEDEEVEVDKSRLKTLTQEEIDSSFRAIFITTPRKTAIEEMSQLLLGEQHGDPMKMFDTSFSWSVHGAYGELQKLLRKKKQPSEKINYLFAFNFLIDQYDHWLVDYEVGFIDEDGGGKMIKSLAGHFKRLLGRHSAEELALDDGWSYEGVVAFLEDFKKKIETVDTGDESKYKFNFK